MLNVHTESNYWSLNKHSWQIHLLTNTTNLTSGREEILRQGEITPSFKKKKKNSWKFKKSALYGVGFFLSLHRGLSFEQEMRVKFRQMEKKKTKLDIRHIHICFFHGWSHTLMTQYNTVTGVHKNHDVNEKTLFFHTTNPSHMVAIVYQPPFTILKVKSIGTACKTLAN